GTMGCARQSDASHRCYIHKRVQHSGCDGMLVAGPDPGKETMRIRHKLLIAPALAIASLLAFGAIAYAVVSQQNEALHDLARNRVGALALASRVAQDVSEVHSNVYRLFTTTAGVDDDRLKAAIGEQRARIDAAAQA